MNKKGFTLIELLAVIVILGILMLVAIPMVSKYIDNSRKESFVNMAKEYVNAVDKAWTLGDIYCYRGESNTAPIPANTMTRVETGGYYYCFSTTSYNIVGGVSHAAPSVDLKKNHDAIMEKATKSPWNRNVQGCITVKVDSNQRKTYSIKLWDGQNSTLNPSNPTGNSYTKLIPINQLDKNHIGKSTDTSFTYYGGDCFYKEN